MTTNAGTLTYNNSGSADERPASLGTAKVTTNNCEYQFTPGLSTGTGTSTGTVDIVNCPTTSPIVVSVVSPGICTVNVSNQTGIGPVKYSTTAGTPSTVTAEISALNFTVTGSGLNSLLGRKIRRLLRRCDLRGDNLRRCPDRDQGPTVVRQSPL